ncbi:MAG: hypothetical protein ACHP9T_10250 [Caulobacterales bacterium]|jgi:hypothetical protein
MKRTLLTTAAILLLGASLSACFGGGGGSAMVTPTPPPPPPPRFDAQFGANFSTDFQASPNSEPHPVAAGDVVPVNPTAEPVPLPGA